jgi:hypothetical protein
MIVAGTPRTFSVSFRWDGAQLDYECDFLLDTKKRRPVNRPTGKVLLKDNETAERLLYDTANGIAYPRMPEFKKGPVAKARFEVNL